MCHSKLVAFLTLAALTLLICAPAWATNHNEATNGDLSNNGSAPTQLNLTVGANVLTGTSPSSDTDKLTVHIPAGHVFSSLVLNAYSSTDATSFIGVKFGTTIPSIASASSLNGYTHFGTATGIAHVNDNLLPDMGAGYDPGFEAIGFTPPLAAGAYSFWIQQAGTVTMSYQFTFNVTALPPPGNDGDYDGNGEVDAADYVIWRQTFGSSGANLPADGNGNGTVGDEDFTHWAERYGDLLGSGASAAVPEPASAGTLCAGVLILLFRRGCSRPSPSPAS